MAHYGTLGDYRFTDTQEAANDIRSAKVYGPNDEKLGEIDDVVFDKATGGIVYIVVDTGGWLSSHKFIVSPKEIRPSLQHEHDFLIDLTKPQIESLPAYDGGKLTSNDKWDEYERWYRSKWEEDPIMHRTATDRHVTPTTKQQVHSGSGVIPGSTADSARSKREPDLEDLDDETEIAPLHPEVELEESPNMPSYRWSTFEDTLKRRREEVLQASIDNAKQAEHEGEPVRDKERRKAS